ncbi:MAG TPA: lipopolysaccharide heptosyltransferase II [Pseudolabrys sp.]|nr:lipopolysaccharide heptosyltransferase II [Pseudolabrys sp.]
MNLNEDGAGEQPVLLIPYVWIGDFVRCHSVVTLLRAQAPDRPVDVLSSTLCAPLADYMPGVRKTIICDLPRRRLGLRQQKALADRLRAEGYARALVMPRKWKAALAPFLAGIPERVGFVGEARFGLVNDLRWGEFKLPRMIDRCGALALPKDAALPPDWPKPELVVGASEVAAWRTQNGLDGGRPAVAVCPGAVGPSKRWPAASYAEVARRLAADGIAVWVLGGPSEDALAQEVAAAAGPLGRNLTGNDLRNAILALKGAQAAISNDSGLMHVAAALGTPTVGIFGPTSPWHWAPLNPLAATIETLTDISCRPCHKPTCRMGHHRCMRDIGPERVLEAARQAFAVAAARA